MTKRSKHFVCGDIERKYGDQQSHAWPRWLHHFVTHSVHNVPDFCPRQARAPADTPVQPVLPQPQAN
eukprot:401628-Amphidinium_carterae.1